MKAIVFAAGLGTRLKPFTDTHPKALAPIGRTTALGFVIERLVKAGADGIVVNVHHFADQVIDWLDSQDYDAAIEISDERDMLLETGGGLAKIWRESRIIREAELDESIVVHNADIITDAPVDGLLAALEDADISLLVDPKRDSSRRLLFDREKRMTGWLDEKNNITRPAGIDPTLYQRASFGGMHAMRSNILADISTYCGDTLHPFGIVPYYIDRCATTDIRAYEPVRPYSWYDIGTPQRLAAAQEAILKEL